MQQVNSCPVCSEPEFQLLRSAALEDTYLQGEGRLRATGDFHRNHILFRDILPPGTLRFEAEFRMCTNCGLIYFSPRPTAEDLRRKYELVTKLGDTEAREHMRSLVDLRARRSQAIRKRLEPYLSVDGKDRRALDVGGADGHCLAAFTADYVCSVVDFEERDRWPGVTKLADDLEDLDKAASFDIVMCNHTLEHVPAVATFVGRLSHHLIEGGLLYIEVPHGCSGEINRTGNFLTHVNFFSTGSLRYLLEQSGLQVLSVHAGPVLSKLRYLPVIVGICRKNSREAVSVDNDGKGFRITQEESSRTLTASVMAANARLIASDPLNYGVAISRRMWRSLVRPRLRPVSPKRSKDSE